MGTRSLLIIYRRSKPLIYLWNPWDGDFSGVGNDLCKQIKLLLEKYTVEEIQVMLDALDVSEGKDDQRFDPETLMSFIEGKTTYGNNGKGATVSFIYRLKLAEGILSGEGYADDCSEVVRTLTLEQIKTGADFRSNSVILGHVDIESMIKIFKALPAAKRAEALERLAAIG